METYVLDKTFLSIGSIGTGICVRLGASSPTATKYRNYVTKHPGSLVAGSIPAVGISITGCSATGKEVIIRLLGIAKAKLSSTQGTILQGKPMFPRTHGKVSFATTSGSANHQCVGRCIAAEGGGSIDSFIDVLVNPGIV